MLFHRSESHIITYYSTCQLFLLVLLFFIFFNLLIWWPVGLYPDAAISFTDYCCYTVLFSLVYPLYNPDCIFFFFWVVTMLWMVLWVCCRPCPQPRKWFFVLVQQSIGATLEFVFLAWSQFFCCLKMQNWFEIRQQFQNSPKLPWWKRGTTVCECQYVALTFLFIKLMLPLPLVSP